MTVRMFRVACGVGFLIFCCARLLLLVHLIAYITVRVKSMKQRALPNKRRNIGAVAALGAVLLLSACGATIDVSGTWTGIAVFDQGDEFAGMTYTLTLMLVQQGSDLSGHVGFGSVLVAFMVPIQDGSISGSIITVDASGIVSLLGSSGTVSIKLDGECNEISMSGTGEYRVNGVLHTFIWQAN